MLPFYAVIATSGRPDSLLGVLRSIADCDTPENFKGVFLVENGPKSDLEDRVVSLAGALSVTYLYAALPSKSNGLNVALAAIPDEEALIFFGDDDAPVRSSLLAAYAAAADVAGSGCFFGGPVERESGSPDIPAHMVPMLPLSVSGWSPQTISDRMVFLGMNWAAFKSDIEKLGGFDKRFGPGSPHKCSGQESNMQVRLLEAGCRAVYVPEAIVAHQAPGRSGELGWLMGRYYQAGAYRSLFRPREFYFNDLNVAPKPVLAVLDRTVIPGGSAYLRYCITRIMVRSAEKVGLLKGWWLRLKGV